MQLHRDMIWFAKALAAAALVLLLCAGLARTDRTLPLPTSMTAGGDFEQALDRYAKDQSAAIVLIGSSMTVRLREEFFAEHDLRNLAIGGGSALSGLAIIASYPKLPALILIETNVLSRGINPELVQKYAYDFAGARTAFARPVRLAAAYYQGWLSRPRSDAQERARIAALLQGPPTDYPNTEAVAREAQTDNRDFYLEETRANAAQIRAMVTALQARGSRVYFYRLPVQAELRTSKYVEVAREISQQTFPDPAQWLDPDYPLDQLRWADGVHLDERSAALVAQAIDRAIAKIP
jgi:hypothetical protein